MRAVPARSMQADMAQPERAEPRLALDEAEFRAFYEQTARGLRGYLRRALPAGDADDALQEAYLRLLRTPHAALPHDERRAYLYRIAANLVKDAWRAKKKAPVAGGTSPDETPARSQAAGTRIDIARAMDRLRVQEQALLWLAHVEQASHREIAAALDVKEGSVRVLLSRARRKLAAALGVSR